MHALVVFGKYIYTCSVTINCIVSDHLLTSIVDLTVAK